MSDLPALLEAVRLSRDDDTPRLVFADWLDENHPNPQIQLGRIPLGFNSHWHRNLMYHLLGVRDMPRTGRSKWSNDEILAGFKASATRTKVPWSERPRATEIEGRPVLVFDPTLPQDHALVVCRWLQRAAGGCPVSFNRCGTVKEPHVRIGVWFTVQPTEEQQMRETAEALNRAFSTPQPSHVINQGRQ